MWLNPIWDRTLEDVEYARTHQNESVHLKGARNYSDWARITGNIHFLAEQLTKHGYPAEVTCKTDWTRFDIQSQSVIQRILDDIDRIRIAFPAIGTTPVTPELPINHYEKMNSIERIIANVKQQMDNMVASYVYSGEIYSGELEGW